MSSSTICTSVKQSSSTSDARYGIDMKGDPHWPFDETGVASGIICTKFLAEVGVAMSLPGMPWFII